MNKEKMIVVEKSTKWRLSVVASGSLVVGLLDGYIFGSLTQKSTNQQSTVQTSKTQQDNQDSKKKPANADGSTKAKDSNSNQNNEENTTKS